MIGAVAFYVFYSLSITSSKRVLEIKWVNGDFFDSAKKRCNEVAMVQPTTVLDLIVNTSTQDALVEVVETTEGWDRAFILDHCAIVNSNNWTCVSESKLGFMAETATSVRTEFGVLQGRFYRSYTSKDPPNFYSSSISGWQYWGYWAGLFPFHSDPGFSQFIRAGAPAVTVGQSRCVAAQKKVHINGHSKRNRAGRIAQSPTSILGGSFVNFADRHPQH